jgi:hypothetical protein
MALLAVAGGNNGEITRRSTMPPSILPVGTRSSTAAKLKITEATARSHTNRILAKTGTTRQTELIRRFFEATLPGLPATA